MTAIGTVRVYTKKFLEDDIFDGDVEGTTSEDNYEVEDVTEAVGIIKRLGLDFTSTDSTPSERTWASDPDGSYVSDHGTGERTETSAHLEGFAPELAAEIRQQVG